MKSEKDVRRRARLLARGFRPPVMEGDPPEAQPDLEILNDPDDFDMATHERDLVKKIVPAKEGLVMDGTWGGFAEDSGVTSATGEAYANLLLDARRPPEMVVVLKCSEEKSLDRLIDKKAIHDEFERITKQREDLKVKKRAEDRQAFYDAKKKDLDDQVQADPPSMTAEEANKELEDAMATWDTERDAQEAEDDEAVYPADCPEKPDEKAMFEAAGQGIKDQREADEGFLAEFSEAIGTRVNVIELNTDMTADFVHIKLNAQLEMNFQRRPDLIERDLAQELNDKELPFYE
jgi:hypothetical protein